MSKINKVKCEMSKINKVKCQVNFDGAYLRSSSGHFFSLKKLIKQGPDRERMSFFSCALQLVVESSGKGGFHVLANFWV